MDKDVHSEQNLRHMHSLSDQVHQRGSTPLPESLKNDIDISLEAAAGALPEQDQTHLNPIWYLPEDVAVRAIKAQAFIKISISEEWGEEKIQRVSRMLHRQGAGRAMDMAFGTKGERVTKDEIKKSMEATVDVAVTNMQTNIKVKYKHPFEDTASTLYTITVAMAKRALSGMRMGSAGGMDGGTVDLFKRLATRTGVLEALAALYTAMIEKDVIPEPFLPLRVAAVRKKDVLG